jgi:hypothetical protein
VRNHTQVEYTTNSKPVGAKGQGKRKTRVPKAQNLGTIRITIVREIGTFGKH